MNRVIKFRAWDTKTNIMLNWDFLKEKQSKYLEYDWLHSMEFTGLLDKNGVEIYEGDILRNNQEEATAVVRWEETGARWSFDEIGGFDDGVGRGNWDLNMGYAKNSEVIGNKYSNPELLKEVK